ncbi:MAG: nucleotidyltransferase domain-containing protein [Elusimicrobia bacterium]|nr:nucleotidyltransferase domain-containing protein [Elusimicrobiota bacterium]
MKSLYKILAGQNQKARVYFKNYAFYAKEIKKTAGKFFTDAKVVIFGSVVRQDYKPDSDIDILIISSEIPEDLFEQAKVKVKIRALFPDAPLELHLITPPQYKNWYKRFVKRDYIEVA